MSVSEYLIRIISPHLVKTYKNIIEMRDCAFVEFDEKKTYSKKILVKKKTYQNTFPYEKLQ